MQSCKKKCSLSLFLSLPSNVVIFLPQAPLASYNPIPRYYARNWSCSAFNGSLGGVRTGKVPKPYKNSDSDSKNLLFPNTCNTTIPGLLFSEYVLLPTFSIFHILPKMIFTLSLSRKKKNTIKMQL